MLHYARYILLHKVRLGALRDVRLGNIRVLTAHQLMSAYDNLYRPADPLELRCYRDDLAALVRDLVSFRNGARRSLQG